VSDYDVSAAVEALTSSDVFVDGEATLSHQSQIESAFRDDHIAVAVLPDGANSTLSANQLADQIKTGTAGKYDTVIVVIDSGKDTYGVASSYDATAITSALYGANMPDGGEAIMAASNTIASIGHPAPRGFGGDDNGTNLVLVGGGVLGLALLGAAVVFLFRKLAGHSPVDKVFERLPAELHQQVAALRELTARHQALPSGGLGYQLGEILENSTELFERLEKKGTQQQARVAAVEYTDTLTKLNRALGSDYYLDILAKPALWEDSDRRLKEVRDAVGATQQQLIKNIRQVNASQDLEFQVALESLVGSMNTPSVESIYTTKPEGEIES
jgi:hypothetical protein